MGKHKAGLWLNSGLLSAFIFSCIISYTAFTTVVDLIRQALG
jgi:manganese transport protein